MINICRSYGEIWDIMFNPSKSQIATFGGQNPCHYQLVLNGNHVPWGNRVKYLGVHFCCDTGYTELTDFYRKFHGHFNSILSEFGKCSNETTGVHLNKTYYLPTLMYGCEVWSLTNGSLHTINVVWNNCFRRIFGCCWRERTLSCFVNN